MRAGTATTFESKAAGGGARATCFEHLAVIPRTFFSDRRHRLLTLACEILEKDSWAWVGGVSGVGGSSFSLSGESDYIIHKEERRRAWLVRAGTCVYEFCGRWGGMGSWGSGD